MKHKCRKCGTIFDLAGKVMQSPINLPRVLQEKRELKSERTGEGKVISTLSNIITGATMAMIPKKDYGKLYDYIIKQASKDNLPEKQKQRYLTMLQKIDELVKQGLDPDTAVKKAYSSANISYAAERQKKAEAAGETEKVSFFKKMRGHALAKTQEGQEISYVERGAPTTKPPAVLQTTGKRVKGKLYEIFIYEIAGIAALLTPQFLGLPSLMYIAIALMVFAPAYILLPRERDVIEEEPGVIGALLIPKAIVKMIAAGLIIANLFLINRLMALAFAFAFYFTLPTRYKTSQPYKMIEGWARLVVGALLAYLFYVTFGGTVVPINVIGQLIGGGGGNPVAVSLFWMGLAFFATLPIHIEDTEGKVNITVLTKYKNLTESGSFQVIERILFAIAMLISLFSFLMPLGGFGGIAGGNATQIMFFAVWALSFFVGLFSGPEGRPAIGILMIAVSLFAFSSSYTGYVGQAIFGYWWPQVQSFGETYMGPLGNAWGQAQTSMADAWLLLTNPTQYYLIQQQRNQAQASIPEGTTQSVEFTKFDLFPSMPGILEPSEPLIGSMELSNKGEYESKPTMILDIWAFWKNATTGDGFVVGSFKTMTCGKGITPSTTNGIGTCNWVNTTYPTEVKVSTFVYEKGGWSGTGVNLADINTNNNLTVYTYSGQTVQLNANLTYNYKVNVSIPIEVINFDTYVQLLETRQIEIKELMSKYTGGPVKATLFTQRQPLRSDETSVVIASIYNEGGGVIKRVNEFKIIVPVSLGSPTDISTSFVDGGCGTETTKDSQGVWLNTVITCSHNKNGAASEIKPQEYKRVSFFITPPLYADIERKTSLIVGLADYTYLKTQSQMLQVANAPPQ